MRDGTMASNGYAGYWYSTQRELFSKNIGGFATKHKRIRIQSRRDQCKCQREGWAMSRGLTLVEMLVVVAIVAFLAVLTIPHVKTATEGARIRDAAEIVSSTLSRARIEAIERRTPVGVQFVRSSEQTEACLQMAIVQDSPLYTGTSDGAMVRVQRWLATSPAIVKILLTSGAIGNGTVRCGDRIQFGTRAWNPSGPSYEIVDDGSISNPPTVLPNYQLDTASVYIDFTSGVTNAGGWTTSHVLTAKMTSADPQCPYAEAGTAGNSLPPTGTWSSPQPFAIWRKPSIMPGVTSVVRLPSRTCIDLYE